MPTDDVHTLHRIVNDRDANLIVEAGAGTGKTYALVSRVVALVKWGVRMDNIVAITFTEAAAAELSDRTRARMEQLLDEDHPDNAGDLLYADITEIERERIAQAIGELDQASIQTIHSFAAQLLRQRPMDIELPPGWSQWDELASAQGFAEKWESWLDRTLGDHSDASAELVGTMQYLICAGVGIGAWQGLAGEFSAEYDHLRRDDSMRTVNVRAMSEAALERVQSLRALCPDADHPLYGQLTTAMATIRSVIEVAGDPLATAAALDAGAPVVPVGSAGSRGKWGALTPTEVRAQFREIGANLQSAIRTAAAQPLLQELRRAFAEEYPAERKADGAATFDDLLVWTRDMLRDNAAARQYFQSRYTHILIDEFQDTDPLQAEIGFYLASVDDAPIGRQSWHTLPLKPGRLFIVGDAKQSIYRFRGADLGVTRQVKEGGQLEALTLSRNRRSQKPVLEWVNAAFHSLMGDGSDIQPEYVELEWHDDIQQHDVAAGVRVFGGASGDAADDMRRQQARHVANMLLAYTSQAASRLNVYDKDARVVRPARVGDVCILIRSRTGLGILERGLEDAGIPYRIEGGSLIFNTQEVQDLLNCLRAIDDPTDAVSLAAALRSPAFACSDVDLLDWREAGGNWNYLAEAMPDEPSAVRQGILRLREYHEKRHTVSTSRLISDFVRERRLEELDLAEYRPREMWRRRQFLIEQARAFESGSVGNSAPWDLRQFLLWAETQQDEGTRITEVPVPETDDDSVRIMTMHAAKGLEFPIVILLGLNQTASARRNNIQVDQSDGVVETRMGDMQTPGYGALVELDRQHDEAEMIRLAYVAATRARDHLVVSLYHQPDRDGDARTEVLQAILNDVDSGLQTHVAVPADPPLRSEFAQMAGEATSQVYDAAGWQQQREETNSRRSVPQAVTATWIARYASTDRQDAQLDPSEVEDKEGNPDAEQPWRFGRGSTAFGSALHAVLQKAVMDILPRLPLPADQPPDALLDQLDASIDRLAPQEAASEGVPDRSTAVTLEAKRAVRNPAVIAAFRASKLWSEIPVAAPIDTPKGQIVLEGIIDLLYLDDDDQLVVVDYKSDDVRDEEHVRAKLDYYQWQGAAYAAAVQRATGKTVKDVQFLFVRRDQAVSIHNLREMMDELSHRVARAIH